MKTHRPFLGIAAVAATALGVNATMIDVSEPTAAVVAPANAGGWGWYQFPTIERLPSGELLIQYQLWPDTQTSAGTTTGKAISTDDGKTWKTVTNVPGYHGHHNGWTPALRLRNGDMLTPITVPPTVVTTFWASGSVCERPASRGARTARGDFCRVTPEI